MSPLKKFLLTVIILTFVVSIGLIKNIVFAEYTVDGKSMQPTLPEGEHFSINKWSYKFQDINRFDIVVFQLPKEKDILVKRVIGLPGDVIEYKNDQLYVNGKKRKEPFLPREKSEGFNSPLTGDFTLEEITGEKIVPDDCIFVIGDNRLNSRDSRHFGFVKMEDVVGKVNPS